MGRDDFEERREARAERFKEKAEKAKAEAKNRLNQAQEMADVIPFGQPILVGHHSEKRDRNYRDKIHKNMEAGVQAENKAEYYERKAKAATNDKIIYSDDPDACHKLRVKIDNAEREQERMKAINKAWRQAGKPGPDDQEGWQKVADKIEMNINDLFRIRKQMGMDPLDRPPFSYHLQNNNANIKRMEKRLAELEKAENTESGFVKDYNGFSVIENIQINRIQIVFNSKNDYLRLCKNKGINLKNHGFKFSKSDGNAWQRHLNSTGREAANRVAKLLTEEK